MLKIGQSRKIYSRCYPHSLDTSNAEDAYKIIRMHNCKNLKAIKSDLVKKFAETESQGCFMKNN